MVHVRKMLLFPALIAAACGGGGGGGAAVPQEPTGPQSAMRITYETSDAEAAAAACPDRICPNVPTRDAANGAFDKADRTATIANVAGIAGLGLLTAGVVLVLTAPKASQRTALGLAPRHGGAALSLSGAW